MLRMLVVDDDPAWRSLYRMAFEGDFEVFEAVDGLDGLEAVGRVQPDVIVLDLRMPHLEGWGFIRQMEQRGMKVPVIISSGVFTGEMPPTMPGVFPALKSPDLRNVWRALEAAVPQPIGTGATLKLSRALEETVWRD